MDSAQARIRAVARRKPRTCLRAAFSLPSEWPTIAILPHGSNLGEAFFFDLFKPPRSRCGGHLDPNASLELLNNKPGMFCSNRQISGKELLPLFTSHKRGHILEKSNHGRFGGDLPY
jgi:hypothetical protein